MSKESSCPCLRARTQMSTFSSKVLPVLTSNNSGARYGMVECSLAMSCSNNACCRVCTLIRALQVKSVTLLGGALDLMFTL